jgi:cell division protein FtsB
MQKLIFSPFFAVVVTIIGLLLLASLLKTDLNLKESAQIRDDLQLKVEILRDEVAQIEFQSKNATSSAVQEKIIRNELLMQKPGEYIVQLPSTEMIEQAKIQSIKSLQSNSNEEKIYPDKKTLDPNSPPLLNWLKLLMIF